MKDNKEINLPEYKDFYLVEIFFEYDGIDEDDEAYHYLVEVETHLKHQIFTIVEAWADEYINEKDDPTAWEYTIKGIRNLGENVIVSLA